MSVNCILLDVPFLTKHQQHAHMDHQLYSRTFSGNIYSFSSHCFSVKTGALTSNPLPQGKETFAISNGGSANTICCWPLPPYHDHSFLQQTRK
jgi:hypothetical protein